MQFILLSFVLVVGVYSAPDNSHVNHTTPVTILYESLCPDSIKFFNEQLYPALNSSLGSYIDVTLVPFGKGNFTEDASTFFCHHGANECYGNKVQACALDSLANQPEELYALLNCLMKTGKESVDALKPYPIESCAANVKVDFAKIVSCANGTAGNELLKKLGEQTNKIQNPLKSVPTIIVDNNLATTDQAKAIKNFKGLLCPVLHGKKPAACNSATVLTTSFALLLLHVITKFL